MTTATPNAAAIAKHFADEKKEIKVLPELRDFLDILNDDERKGLEQDIVASGGANEPIIIWKEQGYIVDGHNRYEICNLHKLPFKTVEKSFKDIEAVKEWMLRNQLNRRNLSPTRISYFRGMLYNQMKQDKNAARTAQGGDTAQKIAATFGVNEKTIRRDGHVAAGIDAVAAAKGVSTIRERLDLLVKKNAEQPGYTKEELEEIGKVEDKAVAVQAVKELDKIKKEAAKEAQKAKTIAKQAKQEVAPIKSAAAKAVPYGVVFIKPAFDSVNYAASVEVKPPLADNAVCYMSVPDEYLGKAMELAKRWHLEYEGAFVFPISEGYESLFSDVRHHFMLALTRGTIIMKGKAVPSIQPKTDDPDAAMIKVIDGYHHSDRRLDMRKNAPTTKGWEKL